MHALKGCFILKQSRKKSGNEDLIKLASKTPFTVNEIEALNDLFKKLSNTIIKDNMIHKVFDLFDIKHNGVIEFGEFVRSLSIFHPNASQEEKIKFAFRLYDLHKTGYIERDELKEMVMAVLNESDTTLSDDDMEAIVDKTMVEANLNRDGNIDQEEWKEFVAKNPSILKTMNLQYLKELSLAFPNFVLNTEVA